MTDSNIKPLPPLEEFDRRIKSANDFAKGQTVSLGLLERFLLDADNQPRWRHASDKCFRYLDGYQMTTQQEVDYAANGLDPRVMNLIGRVVNGVLGQEAKSRRDPQLEPDGDESADVCDVLNLRLTEAKRESCADMAISDAYTSQVVAGIGWVEVSRVSDPRLYPYRVVNVHRNDIWWDWRAKDRLLRDARWLVRKEWRDLDDIAALLPGQIDNLRRAIRSQNGWMTDDSEIEASLSGGANPFINREYWTQVSRAEWLDGNRERIRMYEVWYRVPATIPCMYVGRRWIQVDEQNPAHLEAIRRGLVRVEKRVTMQVRKAMFAGPYRLTDEATDRIDFPYIPFWCFREDESRSPYGLVAGMLAPQDEYNERRMRIQWMLRAQQLIVESDALDPAYNTIDEIADTMMRPDMVAVLNPNRINKSGHGLTFKNDLQLQREQFEQMMDAKSLIQDIPGVYSTMLGNAPAGVTANSAMQTLVEQGQVALGELNDNYALARRAVFDQLVDLIAEDHAEQDLQVMIGAGSTRRAVVLNTIDPQTQQPMNMVKGAKWSTGLAEVPSSPAYMMQSSQILGDMIRALAGTPQASMLIPNWVESTTLLGGQRRQLADDMRRAAGLPVGGDRATAQQWQQQQQQTAAAKSQLEQKAALAQLDAIMAKAALDKAKTVQTRADALATLLQSDQQTADEPDEAALIDAALAEAGGRQQAQQQAAPA